MGLQLASKCKVMRASFRRFYHLYHPPAIHKLYAPCREIDPPTQKRLARPLSRKSDANLDRISAQLFDAASVSLNPEPPSAGLQGDNSRRRRKPFGGGNICHMGFRIE